VVERLGIMKVGGATLVALASMLALGACSNTAGGASERDWTKDLVTLIPAIDACTSAAPKFRTSPGTSISYANRNPDGTTMVRLSATSIEPIEDPTNARITHHYWECTVAADGRQVAQFDALEKGYKRLPGEMKPSFKRADPRILCFEKCLATRAFAPNGELLGYVHYWRDAPDTLNSN
jgi:hypothetical protein